MGVTGLYTFIRDNRRGCVETVDLIAEAERAESLGQGPLEIIVDFCAMRDELWRNIARAFASPPYANPYLTLPTGEYELIYNILRHILHQFKAAGLKLTFVFDCLKISEEKEQQLKHGVNRTPLTTNLTEKADIMSMLKKPIHNFQDYGHGITKLPWFGRMLQGLITEIGFECHAPHGQESDFNRAQLQRQRNAFAVLANDSDYVMFPDCPVIMWRMFDEQKDLRYDPKFQTPVAAPPKLICGRIVSSQIRKYLQLSNHDQLIDMTSILGNLFTAPYTGGPWFLRSLRLPHNVSKFHAVSDFISRHHNCIVEDRPEVQEKIKDQPKFREAFVNAREYFNLRSDPLKLDASVFTNDPILAFLAKPENMLRLGDVASRIHCRTYWPMMLLEEQRLISHQETLKVWLARIFAFVHKKPDEATVHVYFRVRNASNIDYSAEQPVASGDGSTVEEIMADNVEDNMNRFAEIMNCYRGTEQNSPNEEADRLCDMLNPNDFIRAFLVFCWRLALDVEPEKGYFTDGGHLLALTTSMLTLWDPEVREEALPLLEQLYAVRIVPTPSQVTIFNWMQFITFMANDFSLFLCLDHFLDPRLPRLFSFSLFLAYVHIRDPKIWSDQRLQSSLEMVQRKMMLTYSDLLELVPVVRDQT